MSLKFLLLLDCLFSKLRKIGLALFTHLQDVKHEGLLSEVEGRRVVIPSDGLVGHDNWFR